MKGLCRIALVTLVVAACAGDAGITEPVAPTAPSPVSGGILALGVDSTTGASIETNKDDYAPGEIVHLVGRDWAPGETVNLHMTEQPNTHADVDTNVVADASGGFDIHFYDVQTHDLGVTFTLTATGQKSRSVAVATFTDGDVATLNIRQSDCTTPQSSFVLNEMVCAVATTAGTPVEPVRFTWTRPNGTTITANLSTVAVGGVQTATNSQTANQNGTWTVTVCRTNNQGNCAGTILTATFTVAAPNAAPAANAGGPYDAVDEASPLQLNGSGSDTDGTIAGYSWSYIKNTGHSGATCQFSSLTVAAPTFTCNDNGTFTVSLTVTDDDGATSAPSTANVTVNNVKPMATSISTVPTSPGFGSIFTATLNGGDDVSSNDDAVGFQYKFDCGSGYGAYGASNSTSCTANSPNSQTIKATIRDKDGGENEYQTTVSVNNAPPTANAGGNKNGIEGSAVALNGTGSTDPDGTINTYAWSHTVVTADDGTTCAITNGNQATASITCTDDGSFTVTLTVTDDDGATNSQTVNLTLSNANPAVGAGDVSGAEGTAIQLGATGNDPGDNDDAALTYAWTVNSTGIDASGSCSLSAANIQNPTVTCTDDSNLGNFTVSVTVSDGDGGSASTTANLTVTNANPVASAQNATGAEASVIQLNGSGDDPGNNDDAALSYHWSINTAGIDGGGQCTLNNANIQNPTVSCTDDSNGGTFALLLTVTDDDGGSHTDGATLTVTNANPTANAHGPYSGVEGSPISLAGAGDDPASNDDGALTYFWSVNTSTMDAGAACTFSSATAQNPTLTCNDDTNGSNVGLTLKVMDDDGGEGTHTVNLTVSNANPAANPGGPYSGNEGSAIQLTGSGDDPGNNDDGVLTYQWSVNSTGIDASGSCLLSSATAQNPTVTCNDDSNGGNFTVSLTVKDDDGGTSTTQTANLTVANVNPVADGGGPYTGNEGANVSLAGSRSDAGSNDTHTYAWTWVAQSGVDASASCTFTTATQLSPTVKCTDDGVYKLTLTVKDDDLGEGANDATLTLSNANPTIAITSHVDGALFSLLNGPVSVTGSITEAGTNDTHQCRLELDGVLDETGAYSAAAGLGCSPSVMPDEAGVYTLTIRVKDDDGGEGTASIMIVVYDPSAGFVTGGGWINSPATAYKPNLALSGKATFGFVSKYKRGATTPDGNTEFQFHAGGMNFHSATYQWLVVNQAGTNAQFKGTGTINGQGSYTFMLWATDNGNSGDTFRIQITDNNDSDAVVYDNGNEQVIANGSIVIHTGGKK